MSTHNLCVVATIAKKKKKKKKKKKCVGSNA